jgi:outer membrane protein assembly factor BamE (lipoprotein component of BamABCDE complex)
MFTFTCCSVPLLQRAGKLALLALLGSLIASCISANSERGVEPLWSAQGSEPAADRWTVGSTNKRQILKDLGPPSQVVTLGDETVFYYLRENMKVNGLVLLLYNNVRVSAEYDRAIFFFNKKGVLTELSVSDSQ